MGEYSFHTWYDNIANDVYLPRVECCYYIFKLQMKTLLISFYRHLPYLEWSAVFTLQMKTLLISFYRPFQFVKIQSKIKFSPYKLLRKTERLKKMTAVNYITCYLDYIYMITTTELTHIYSFFIC